MTRQVKVGVFDSGIGGLTVVKEIFNRLPWVSVVYFGDTEHVPYGNKTVNQLISYGDQICNFFGEHEVVGIVAACNTSSSVSLGYLQEKYSHLPIIGVVEPGVKVAIAATRNNRIGVIATEATVKSEAHQVVTANLSDQVVVYSQSCPKFVPLVEAGEVTGRAAKAAAVEYIQPLLELQIDTLILGCTHYPFLKGVIREVVGNKVKLIDPAEATVEILAQTFREQGITKTANAVNHYFYVSGDPVSFKKVGQRLIGLEYLPDVTKKSLEQPVCF